MQELEAVVRRLKESNRLEPTPDPRGDEPPIFTEPERPRLAAIEPEPAPVEGPVAAPVAAAPEAAPVASADHDGPVEAPVEPRRRLFSDLPAVPVLRTGGGGGGGGGEGPPDDPMDDFDDEDEGGFGPFATWFAAAAAIALVIGVSVWTYKLGQRDAMDVPIVRAIEGPSRVSPTDPGGTQMAHQGLSVNDVLEGGGVRSVADSVTTAPGEAGLREEDRAQLELASLDEARRPTARPSIRRPAVATNEERVALAMEDVLDYALDNAGQGAARLPQIGRDETVSAEPAVTPTPDQTEEVAAAPKSQINFERPTVTATAPAEEADVEGDTVREILLAIKEEEAAKPVVDAVEDGAEVLANVTGTEINTLPVQNATPAEAPVTTETVAEVAPEPAPEAPKPVAEDVTASAEAVAEKLQASAEAQLVLAGLPVPPAGEGSIYAPARGTKPAQRPVRLAALATTTDVPSAAGTVTDATVPAPAIAAAAAAPAPSADNLDVIPLPAGTRMIQIGAYGSEAIARQQWDRFSSLHGDVLGGKEHYVQRTNNSGKIFYRLRVAGYATKDESRGACDALSARGLPCITVTLR